jgi:hypothetical protein
MGTFGRLAADGPCDTVERVLASARPHGEDAVLVNSQSTSELFAEELAQVNWQGAFEI